MGNQRNPGYLLAHLTEIVEGLDRHLPKGTATLVIQGKKAPVAEVIALFRSHLRVFQDPIDIQIELDKSIQRRKGKTPGIKDDIDAVETALKAVLGVSNPRLKRFGVRPLKRRRRLTGRKKVVKAERAAATRKARGTMGKRQKKLLKARLRDAKPPSPEAPPTAGPSPGAGR